MTVEVLESYNKESTFAGYADEPGLKMIESEPRVAEIPHVDADSVNESNFDATRVYLNELGKSKLLTADQEKIYGKRSLNGDQEARRIMIESNLRLGGKNFPPLFKQRFAIA